MHIKRAKTTINSGSSDGKGNSSLLIFTILYFLKNLLIFCYYNFFPVLSKKKFSLENASHKIMVN